MSGIVRVCPICKAEYLGSFKTELKDIKYEHCAEMTLNEYATQARSTAIYPKEFSVIYPVLKMNGEAGECAEKVGKWMRDDLPRKVPIDREAMLKELGDVLWYVANAAADLGYSLNDVATANIAKLAARKANNTIHGSGDDR